MTDEFQLYSTREAAMMCEISPSTMTRLRWYGRGPRYLKVRGDVFYSGGALEEWMRKRDPVRAGLADEAVTAARR